MMNKLSMLVGSAVALAGAANADCDTFDTNEQALIDLANLVCEEIGDGEEWYNSTCDAWSILGESEIPFTSLGVWNLLAGNGSLSVGARLLRDGISESGNVIQGTKRTFIVEDILDDTFELNITHKTGRADLEVDVCTITPDGDAEIIRRYVDDNRSGLSETVSLEEGSMVAIQLRARSTDSGVQRYKYDIELDADNLSEAEVEARTRPYGKIGKIDASKVSKGKVLQRFGNED